MDKHINSNGIQLCYQDLGDEFGEVILLIAGLGEQLGEWPDNFCKLLTNTDYRVIRYDNRDIGLSDKMSGQRYSLNDMAEDAFGLLNALEIERAHVVGMSMGGMIAQIFAAEKSSKVSSLCLIMSSSSRPGLPKPTPAVQEIMAKPSDGTVNGFIENWVEGKFLIDSPAYPADEEALRKRAAKNCARSYNPGGYMRHLAAIAENGSRAHLLEKITCPTLILHGAQDPLIPQECGEDLALNIADSRLTVIDGMGHNLPEELHATLCHAIIENIERSNK